MWASQFNFTYRYIVDVLSLNNQDLENYLGRIYPAELGIKTRQRTTPLLPTWIYSCRSERTVSCGLPFTTMWRLQLQYHILSSNIPSSPAYNVFISQLIRYARDCSTCECFILRAARLSSKLLGQGYVSECLKSSLRKFYGRYGDLIKHYEVPLSQMLHGILGHCHLQWHPQLIRHYTNYQFWPYYQLSGGFHRTLQLVWLANRGRLLLRTPGGVTFGTCIVLMLRPFFPELVMSTDLLRFEHPSVLIFCLNINVIWQWCSKHRLRHTQWLRIWNSQFPLRHTQWLWI